MQSARNRVIVTLPASQGWATVELQARLFAELTDAELVVVSDGARRAERLRRAGGLLPRRVRGSAWCVVVAPAPVHLSAVVSWRHLLSGFSRVGGWVVDSFWDDRIPFVAKGRGHFDRLFVTDKELVGSWQDQTGTPTTWLPFGADVVGRGSGGGDRPVDLLRVGRQPPAWDDDADTARAAAALGIRFQGRAPAHRSSEANQRSLLTAMQRAKLTLSFTNLVSPDTYTHPTRDYLTGRWTDALGCGCVVAGVPPRTETARSVLWPGSTIAVDPGDRSEGLAQVAAALREWSPADATRNHATALRRLDWRWRFRDLLTALDVPLPDRLESELADLRARIGATLV